MVNNTDQLTSSAGLVLLYLADEDHKLQIQKQKQNDTDTYRMGTLAMVKSKWMSTHQCKESKKETIQENQNMKIIKIKSMQIKTEK